MNEVFFDACRAGDIRAVKESSVDARAIGWGFEFAAGEGQMEVVEYLWPKADPEHFQGAVLRACSSGNWDMVEFLLKARPVDDTVALTFSQACCDGHLHIIKHLDKDYQILDKDRQCGLGFAASRGHLSVVRYLLTDNRLSTEDALFSSVAEKHFDITQYLLTHSEPNLTARGNSLFHFCIQHNRVRELEYLVLHHQLDGYLSQLPSDTPESVKTIIEARMQAQKLDRSVRAAERSTKALKL